MTAQEIIFMLIKALQAVCKADTAFDRQQIAQKAIADAQDFLYE